MAYATAISGNVGLISNPPIPRDGAIMGIMLSAATLMVLFCKLDAAQITNMPTFKSGMSACICVLGVAWLGNVFVKGNMVEIQAFAGDLLSQYSWLLAVVLFFSSMLLYSQGATTKALMPAALALGVSPAAIASFAAVSALFVLPTYPTLLAAVEMDDTGSTRIGKAVFNHPSSSRVWPPSPWQWRSASSSVVSSLTDEPPHAKRPERAVFLCQATAGLP
jgi:anaerobic C4-dicarboxylate transporter DcuA